MSNLHHDFGEDIEDDFEDELDRMRTRKGSRRNKPYGSRGHAGSDRSGNGDGQREKKRSWFPLILLILAIVLTGYGYSFWKKAGTGHWTVAVFGVDARDGGLKNGSLADVQMVCTINRETGEIKLLSVFRDTYSQIDENGTFHKINEAYFKGGPKQGVYAIETNLDLNMDDYAAFNWKAVADVINILGGIDLEITEREFAYINSFITETVETTGIGSVHLTQSGMNHLDGVQAVAYSRLRLMDTDFQRTQRQRKIIALAMEKAKKADIGVLNNIVVTVLPQISTSINAADLIALAKNIDKYYIGETSGFPFAHEQQKVSGRDCVIPATLESNVIQLHDFLYGTKDYKPSQTVKAISKKIIADTGIGDAGIDTESGRDTGSGSGAGKSQSPEKPTETQASTAAAEVPLPETVPGATEDTVDAEFTEQTDEPEGTEEIPETIPIPETIETRETRSEDEVGPGITTEAAQPQIPLPEPVEKPTIEQIGPGVDPARES